MPRTSRDTVIFTVDGREWKAKFTHQHAAGKDGGVPFHKPDNSVVVVQHVTTCRLSKAANPNLFVTGISLCSLKDRYQWKRGIRRAFQKALEKAQYCKFTKENDKEVVVSMKPLYGEIMKSFFEELPKKAYWPHDRTKAPPIAPVIIDGVVVKVEDVPRTISATVVPPLPLAIIPPENRNGLSHIGSFCD